MIWKQHWWWCIRINCLVLLLIVFCFVCGTYIYLCMYVYIYIYIFTQGFITSVGTLTEVFPQDSAIPLLDPSDLQWHLLSAVRTPGCYLVHCRAPLPFGQGADIPRVHNVWGFFETVSKTVKFHYNVTRVMSTLYEERCIFLIISRWVLLRMRIFSDKISRENLNTHLIFSIFLPKIVLFMK
jgi:hypothetical protein